MNISHYIIGCSINEYLGYLWFEYATNNATISIPMFLFGGNLDAFPSSSWLEEESQGQSRYIEHACQVASVMSESLWPCEL